ncbi:MAG: DUF362 domain-containing protein [Candidatus Bathyarchaeia archaeon]
MAIGKSKMNSYVKDGKALVSKVSGTANVKESILKAVNLIGGFNKAIKKGDDVLLKPNFNTADPPPASSDPEFVKAVIELLFEHGAGKVVVGESSMFSLHTRNVFKETGMLSKAEEAGAELVFFDEGRWVKVPTGGKCLKTVSLPETALNATKLVYVCCMKAHKFAKFTLSLKLAVGFMKPSERMLLHMRHLEEKIADLNLVVRPSLIIMDGRKCFINGGPACGELREPNIVLASGDRVAIDVEALRIIEGYEGASLKEDPWSYTQIHRAVELGLGVKNEQEYAVISE